MTPKRIVSIALTWSLLWLVFAALIFTALGIIDPDSIDEGKIEGAIFILGPMGILTGLAFAFLLSVASKRTKSIDLSLFSGAGVGSRGFCARPDRLPGSRRCRPGREHRSGSCVLRVRRRHLNLLVLPGVAMGSRLMHSSRG